MYVHTGAHIVSYVYNFTSRVYASPALYSQLLSLRRFLNTVAQEDPFLRAIGGLQRFNDGYEEILRVVSNRSALILDESQPLMKSIGGSLSISSIILLLGLPSLACSIVVAKVGVKDVRDRQEEYEMQPVVQQDSLLES